MINGNHVVHQFKLVLIIMIISGYYSMNIIIVIIIMIIIIMIVIIIIIIIITKNAILCNIHVKLSAQQPTTYISTCFYKSEI